MTQMTHSNDPNKQLAATTKIKLAQDNFEKGVDYSIMDQDLISMHEK